MSEVTLTEALLGKIAGWEAMKRARAYVQSDQVLSSEWKPPLLRGVVQTEGTAYRAGLVIKNAVDVENLCTCREARQWGTLCAHSVAVGLHFLRGERNPPATGRGEAPSAPPNKVGATLRRAEPGQVAEPLEIFVILPPNLEQAVTKDRIMVCFEGKWRGGRTPLNALPKTQAFQLSAPDAALLDAVEGLAEGEMPAMLLLSAKALASLLPLLVEHPRVSQGKTRPLTVTKAPWPIVLRATLESTGEIELRMAGQVTPPALLSRPSGILSSAPSEGEGSAEEAIQFVLIADGWIARGNTIQPLGLPETCLEVLRGPMRLSRAQVPLFLSRDWPLLERGQVEANFQLEDFTVEPQPPRFLLHLTGGLAQLQAQLQCAYGPRIMTIGVTAPDETVWLPDPDHATRYGTRDLACEQAAQARLLRAGFKGPDAQGRWQLLGQNAVLSFFAREYPQLQKEWAVTLEERLERSTSSNLERIEPRVEIIPAGVQWFDFAVNYSSQSGERFSAADIQRLLLTGQSHVRLRNGKLAVLDTGAVEELQEVLLDCAPQQHAGGYRINSAQAGFLEATVREQGWAVQAPAAWQERARQQAGQNRMECPPLGALENVLRPYQKAGVAWMRFLRANGFGGILADEMGLGKTLQTLAFVQAVIAESGAGSGRLVGQARPTLVVCPTSLVSNWIAEAQKFTPGLRVLALQGPDRHRLFDQIPRSDLVITSYALVRRDADRYREMELDTVVLDEAQHIKNRQTQNAQAVKTVRARHRLALTGTPLENSVLDLWSIFDFLMPGYLGAAQDFRERYEQPITRDHDAAAQARLARRVRPFLLRRVKREVAPELPARIEQVSFCELTEDQRTVYQQLLDTTRQEVSAAVGAQGLARSKLLVLNALLRLRQVCCDLRLLQLDHVNPETASGKMELFAELLEEVLDGGHRVLVFSQFVSLLALLREKLRAEGVGFCYLDGSTPDRGDVVRRFQSNPDLPVFLISLKAGGVGLNLTAADTVIHFDPWWNPAVEDQATDRAHRIGQTRVVNSYKLVTRGTVEEKILLLQARKREVIQSTLGSEEQLAETLTWEEIQELLAG